MYREWARERLSTRGELITVYNSSLGGCFGFKPMVDYSGRMASSSNRHSGNGRAESPKQGWFDLKAITGQRYGTDKVCHRDIITDLLHYSTYEKCMCIWRDQCPEDIADSEEEVEILYSLALLFFEQEINWGNEVWQRHTHFSPSYDDPCYKRPRDMLMGFIAQAYELGLDGVVSWDREGRSATFYHYHEDWRRRYGWNNYPRELKRYFTMLEHDASAEALMADPVIREMYLSESMQAPVNPYYIYRGRRGFTGV